LVIQATGLPGRTVTITRRPKKLVEEEFRFRQQIAAVCESSHLLVRPQKKKETEVEIDADGELLFKVDAAVECDYEGKEEYWPCVVRRVNDNGTYDLEYVGDYKWVGIQRGVDPEIVQKRGENDKKARGEGIWHWDGMSDSEDDDFRDESDDEQDDDDKDEKKSKDRIDFFQFNQLYKIIAASGRNLDACLAALHRLGSVPGVMPFTDVDKLAAAVEYEISHAKLESYGKPALPYDSEDMFLLNLLYAPRRSRLHSVLKTLARIENASHICAWTKASNVDLTNTSIGLPFGCPSIDLIELPRLKLSFTARPDHLGVLRLYSVDHVDIYITNERNSLTSKMLAGIPHSLLLSNVRGETQVLVPVIPPYRPFIGAEPFSTFIVLNRKAIPLSERFFLYPVHVSLSFLLTKGLNSAIYLMLLRFLHRDYDEVFRLADSIATDTSFNSEGNDIFQGFARTCDDWHPDAHSCRLKISLVTIDSGTVSPWDLTIESARHIVKLDSVTSSCRLAPEEELQLLESDFVVTSTDCPKYDEKMHDEYSMALCYNRKHQLRTQMDLRTNPTASEGIVVPCKVPPRTLLTNWPYYQDNTVFGENYAQMVEIVSADEGELSWTNQVAGGDDLDAPPGGWLVIACFHTLWSSGCVKMMPGVTELVPLYQDMATFLTVRADCHGMAPISKSLNVTTFPTFVFFRGGVEIDRIVGHERIFEKLVRTLGTHIKDTDKMAHSKRKHRIRLEKALEAGLEGPLEEEIDERGELEWTWDQEQCGESMRIEKEGMFVVLRDSNDDDDPIQWEYSRNNRTDWKEFGPETAKPLEKAYRAGLIFRDGYANAGEISIWPHNVEIGTYEVGGFYCNWNSTGDSAYVRRRGDRVQVPHEENYLSKEQKERDERSAEWRARLAAYKKKMREERYGSDIEAIKGSIGMLPNTGVHTWTMKWNHEPARRGVADGFGVCGDGCENFGPLPMPCLGGTEDTGASLALYANGLLYHNGKIIHTELGSRNIPPVEPEQSTENEEKEEENEEQKERDIKKKKKKAPKAPAAPKVEEVKIEDRAPLFGKKSLVTCILDTTNGGSLKFMVDKVPLDLEITQLYSLLGASELFPAICLCPFDHVEEDPLNPTSEQQEQPETVEEPDEEEFYDEDGNYDEEAAAEAMAAEAQAAEQAAAEALLAVEELGQEPSVTLLPPGWEEEEQRQKEAALAAASAAKAQAEEAELAAAAAAQAQGEEAALAASQVNSTVAGVIEEQGKESKDQEAPVTTENPMPEFEETVPPPVVEEGEVPTTEPGEVVTETTPEAAGSIEVEIPLNRIRWMWESESGWQVYSKESSRELEQAVRDGKANYTLTIGGNNHKCNLEAKVMLDDRDGNNRRLRRHVVGEGMAELWELLTMKYEKPMGLTGQGFLKILEKVWGGNETMDGKQAGLGFLFLYSLLSGESRSKAISSGYGGYGPTVGGYMTYGGKGGYSSYGKKSSSSSSDSHRFALLLTQLFVDRHAKSLPASIANVLGRNRQVCLRMPRFKDTRKAMTTAFFNGWVDESEPRSPLGELFAKVVPQMRTMKRKAAFHFPPPPPHVELPPALDKYTLSPKETDLTGTKYVEWERPELSDYGCENRSLESIDSQTVANMASMVHYRLGQDILRPLPPIKIEDAAHFSKIIRENPSRLFVVDFYATWCGPCKALAPVFRQLALRTPTALFLKVDVDDCDDLAAAFKIETMPTVKFMRGGISPSNVVAEIQGGGPQFLVEFSKVLNSLSKPAELNLLRKFLMNSPGENIETVLQNMSTTENQVKTLATQPLAECNSFIMMRTRREIGIEDVDRNLAFDVTEHEASKTAVAHSVLSRIKDDVAAYADTANHAPVSKISQLSDLDVKNFFAGVEGSEKKIMEAHQLLKSLLQKLYQLRDSDAQMVEDTIPLLERASNWVNVDEEIDDELRKSKTKFCLKRTAGINSNVWIEFLFGILISSKGEEDLLRLNPYLSPSMIKEMMSLITISMLRSNRLGHTNRCIGIAISLEALLQKILKIPMDQRTLQGPILMPKLLQSGEELSKNIAMARHYIVSTPTGSLDFDPRYLVFEFVWNIQLRQKQVEIVDNFRENLKNGVSKVKQMIMGAGKTSVVAPLLALILADGKSLVLSVVPKALVEMSRTRMRETFAAIMVKRIYTLDFDRSTTVRPAMRRSLENAARNRGVVVATPTTIKSIMLSYVEVLQRLKESYSLGVKSKLEELKLQASELAKILSLFREGVMLLDEVDLILHPLKSELNFPIGDKFDLDGSDEGERWNLPIHLLDAIFYTQTGKVSTFENRGLAVDILKRLSNCVQQGVTARNLQMLPHSKSPHLLSLLFPHPHLFLSLR
jgi:thiol-disulfide isomerase/thioredoxin